MYEEIYYAIGNPLECDEDFMDSIVGYSSTIEKAKQEIEKRVKFYGGCNEDYEIAKVTTIIERKVV